jgi:hypothetical protein
MSKKTNGPPPKSKVPLPPPLELTSTIAIIQSDCIEHDGEIRSRLMDSGFTVSRQAVATLDGANGRQFANMILEEAGGGAENNKTAKKAPARSQAESPDLEPLAALLSGAPFIVLELSTTVLPDAVAGVLSLLGPLTDAIPSCDEEADKGEAEASLRKRFGKCRVRCAVRAAASAPAAEAWAHFFFGADKPGVDILTGSVRDHHPSASPRRAEARLTLEQLLAFIFPAGVLFPQTTGRLFAFAKYGPLRADPACRAAGSLSTEPKKLYCANRFITFELHPMCQQIEDEIQAARQGPAGGVFTNYTKAEIREILQEVPRCAADGISMRYDHVQTCLLHLLDSILLPEWKQKLTGQVRPETPPAAEMYPCPPEEVPAGVGVVVGAPAVEARRPSLPSPSSARPRKKTRGAAAQRQLKELLGTEDKREPSNLSAQQH